VHLNYGITTSPGDGSSLLHLSIRRTGRPIFARSERAACGTGTSWRTFGAWERRPAWRRSDFDGKRLAPRPGLPYLLPSRHDGPMTTPERLAQVQRYPRLGRVRRPALLRDAVRRRRDTALASDARRRTSTRRSGAPHARAGRRTRPRARSRSGPSRPQTGKRAALRRTRRRR